VKLLGPRSETLSDLQLELLADEEPGTTLDEVEAEAQRAPLPNVPPRQRRPHPGRKRLSENLPRVEEVIPCAEQTCRECGTHHRRNWLRRERAVGPAAGAVLRAGGQARKARLPVL
jgi:hypothetical protein